MLDEGDEEFRKLGLLSGMLDAAGYTLVGHDFENASAILQKNGVKVQTYVANEGRSVRVTLTGPGGNRALNLTVGPATNLKTVLRQIELTVDSLANG
jgi:hypothetical protein